MPLAERAFSPLHRVQRDLESKKTQIKNRVEEPGLPISLNQIDGYLWIGKNKREKSRERGARHSSLSIVMIRQ